MSRDDLETMRTGFERRGGQSSFEVMDSVDVDAQEYRAALRAEV